MNASLAANPATSTSESSTVPRAGSSGPDLSRTGKEVRWGIVADDLTGAADSAVGLADAGRTVRILLGEPGQERGEVPEFGDEDIVVSTAARGVSEAEALSLTEHAVQELLGYGAQRLFVKIDSAGRGPIASQVEGALLAWSEAHPASRALICPAYPRFGRQVIDGNILIDGAPLAHTATAHDPVSPRDEGDLTVVIPGAVRAGALDSSEPSGSSLARLAVADAESDDDLDRLASHIAGQPAGLVAVGSGGLAAALGRTQHHHRRPEIDDAPVPSGRLVVAVSSQHPVALAQVRELTRAGDEDIEIVQPDISGMPTPEQAAEAYGRQVRNAVERAPVAGLVLVGGDGAAVALAALGATALVVHRSLITGCPLSTVVGGAAAARPVVTKSGGFGEPKTLVEIVRRLRGQA